MTRTIPAPKPRSAPTWDYGSIVQAMASRQWQWYFLDQKLTMHESCAQYWRKPWRER